MATPTASSHPARRPTRQRRDIEGLRAVAIISVVGYHAAENLVPSGFIGVDVFFVISGFLITSLILREVEATGRLSLARFWSRRAKRLLPATAVVLVFSAVVAWLWLPRTQIRTFGWDIADAALYVINWRLAGRSVNYLAEGTATTPVEHFWSLAVEEQFYIIWPLLIVAIVWLARRARWRLRPALAVTLGLVSLASLAISIRTSGQPSAFFVSQTRIWELGIGALTALAANRLAGLRRRAANVLGLGGLVAIAISVIVFGGVTAWPSWRPLLPCLGTAAVIVAGLTPGRSWATAILGWRPLVWIGGLSYSIYLWHWPFLVGATAAWGPLGLARSIAVLAASLVPAYLVHKLIENPIRFAAPLGRSPALALAVGLNCTAVGVAAGLVLPLTVPSSGPAAGPQRAPGALMVTDNGANLPELAQLDQAEVIVPAPEVAVEDLPDSYASGCNNNHVSPPEPCVLGDPTSPTRLVAVGDSMIQQWEPALDLIGRKNHLRIELYTMSQCVFAAATVVKQDQPYRLCDQWVSQVLDLLKGDPPSLVLVSQGTDVALTKPSDSVDSANQAAMVNGLHQVWAALAEAGVPVAVVLKNPTWEVIQQPYECVARHRDRLTKCAQIADLTIANLQRQAAASSPVPIKLIDLNPYICAQTCPMVIGNVLLYRQGTHLTRTYVESLMPRLETQLLAILADR